MNGLKEKAKYLTVRSEYMRVFMEQEKSGSLEIPAFIKIAQVMDEIVSNGLLNEKYYQIKKWKLQGCINNLFRLKSKGETK